MWFILLASKLKSLLARLILLLISIIKCKRETDPRFSYKICHEISETGTICKGHYANMIFKVQYNLHYFTVLETSTQQG